MNATACCHHYEKVGFQINTMLFVKSNHPPSNKILMVDRLPRCVFIKNLHLSLWNVSSLFCPTFNASFSKIIPFFVLHFVPKTTIRKVQRHRIWYLGAALHSLVGCRVVIEAPLWDRYNNFFHSYSNPEIGFQDWMGRKSTFILILLANEIPIAKSWSLQKKWQNTSISDLIYSTQVEKFVENLHVIILLMCNDLIAFSKICQAFNLTRRK